MVILDCSIKLSKREVIHLSYNYKKLSGLIVEKFGTRGKFAAAMGWSERTLSLKMNSERFWTQKDICKASKLLKIHAEDIPVYFFDECVQ